MQNNDCQKLRRCPFCGGDNSPKDRVIIQTDRKDVYKHWYNGCVLSGFTIKDIESWNRRVSE